MTTSYGYASRDYGRDTASSRRALERVTKERARETSEHLFGDE
jgi:hypothetical protein